MFIVNGVSGSSLHCINFGAATEPTCGSGTMVIACIWEMKKRGFDYRNKSFFVAQDIDIRCVWMAYIQLTLYQIPAVVIHSNTLTMESWSYWYTPNATPYLMDHMKPQGDETEVAG